MSVYTKQYILKNENTLPTGSKVLDPYDNNIFLVDRKDTLSKLLDKISKYREGNGYDKIDRKQLEKYIVTQLANTCPKNKFNDFFEERMIPPTLGQMYGFVKFLAQETLHPSIISVKQRKDRALKCLKCNFHQTHSLPPKVLNKIPIKSLQDSTSFPEEKLLGVCGVCGCGLQKKIKIQITNILVSLTPVEIDKALTSARTKIFKDCWMFSEAISQPHAKKILQGKMRNGVAHGEQLLHEYTKEQLQRTRQNG